ncbi:MAG: polysaccharide deacetylase family protein [Desulfuromonadia bacterium]
MIRLLFTVVALLFFSDPRVVSAEVSVPILLYHRLGPTVADGMTMRTSTLESHLSYLSRNGYRVIPLRQLVAWYRGKGAPPPPKSVVIVQDDAHRSVYTDMYPLVKKYRVPVTIFIYPSAVSNASYAMTWDQLRELKQSGLFDFQSHTYWHPNFKKERRRLKPGDFDRLVRSQLSRSKEKIQQELGVTVDLLAWPFGIYDDDLIRRATAAGYVATFTIERRHATPRESILKLPRYLMTAADDEQALARLLAGNAPKRAAVY